MLLMHNYLTRLLRTPLARASYIVLFDLKPLIEDSNLQVYMYCVHTRKRASGAPRTHSRACKISKFPGGVPQDPPHTNPFCGALPFVFALGPPILSAALARSVPKASLLSKCHSQPALSRDRQTRTMVSRFHVNHREIFKCADLKCTVSGRAKHSIAR